MPVLDDDGIVITESAAICMHLTEKYPESQQRWWLRDVLSRLDESTLFYGAAVLTAITDNAALTYPGSLVGPRLPK